MVFAAAPLFRSDVFLAPRHYTFVCPKHFKMNELDDAHTLEYTIITTDP